jgi:hypothetical protein
LLQLSALLALALASPGFESTAFIIGEIVGDLTGAAAKVLGRSLLPSRIAATLIQLAQLVHERFAWATPCFSIGLRLRWCRLAPLCRGVGAAIAELRLADPRRVRLFLLARVLLLTCTRRTRSPRIRRWRIDP